MVLAVLGIPASLGLLLWALNRLEIRYVRPIEHAERITKLLEKVSTPEEIEEEVARALAPHSMRRRPRIAD